MNIGAVNFMTGGNNRVNCNRQVVPTRSKFNTTPLNMDIVSFGSAKESESKKQGKIITKDSALSDFGKNLDKNKTGWIVIPSKNQDPKHFDENLKKIAELLNCDSLKVFIHDYLQYGSVHIYCENGEPKVTLSFAKDSVMKDKLGFEYTYGDDNEPNFAERLMQKYHLDKEVVKKIEKNPMDLIVQAKYLDIVKEHIKKYKVEKCAQDELSSIEREKEELDKLINKFKENGIDLKTCSTKKIFDTLNIAYKVDSDGLLIINEYKQPSKYFTFEDIGIDENKILKDVKEIKGRADFSRSSATDIGKIQKIGGIADFRDSQIESLNNLQSIGGYADFRNSKIKKLDNLKTIEGEAIFAGSEIESLGSLQSIGGDAIFSNSNVSDIGQLKNIGEDAVFGGSDIKDLKGLKDIGGTARFDCSKVEKLGELKNIGRSAHFENSIVKNLGKLENIGGEGIFKNSQIESLGNLKNIGESAFFSNSPIKELGKLETIGGFVVISDSKLTKESFKNVKVEGHIKE